MVSKTKFPGICNNCGKKSEFYIRCGIHTLQLCGTCAITLSNELMKHATESREKMEAEYNHSRETGLLPPIDPSKYTITESGNVIRDNGKVPPTGGIV